MAKEIERKFLVNDTSYRSQATEVRCISQGYITREQDRVVRVRIADNKAFITVKTRNDGAVRNEWEFEIPVADAREMLGVCAGRIISKKRYIVPAGELCWEIDEFEGDLAPLVVAEIELPAADAPFVRPSFVGREVTDDPQYFNSALATRV